MKLAFRIECPRCHYGYEWRDAYVNQGWLELRCNHCDEMFYTKINIPTVSVETSAERPDCMAIRRYKEGE